MTESEFLSLGWEVTPQGGYALTLHGKTAYIHRAMTCAPTYGVTVGDVFTAQLDGARITDVETAKRAAYRMLKEETPCTIR